MLRKPSNFHLYHRQYPNFKQLSSNALIVDYGRLPFFNLAQKPGRPPFSVPSFDFLFFHYMEICSINQESHENKLLKKIVFRGGFPCVAS